MCMSDRKGLINRGRWRLNQPKWLLWLWQIQKYWAAHAAKHHSIQFLTIWLILLLSLSTKELHGPGLVLLEDWQPRGCEFESQHLIQDGSFSHLFAVKLHSCMKKTWVNDGWKPQIECALNRYRCFNENQWKLFLAITRRAAQVITRFFSRRQQWGYHFLFTKGSKDLSCLFKMKSLDRMWASFRTKKYTSSWDQYYRTFLPILMSIMVLCWCKFKGI